MTLLRRRRPPRHFHDYAIFVTLEMLIRYLLPPCLYTRYHICRYADYVAAIEITLLSLSFYAIFDMMPTLLLAGRLMMIRHAIYAAHDMPMLCWAATYVMLLILSSAIRDAERLQTRCHATCLDYRHCRHIATRRH